MKNAEYVGAGLCPRPDKKRADTEVGPYKYVNVRE